MFKVVCEDFSGLEQGIRHWAHEGHDGQVEQAQVDSKEVVHFAVVLVRRTGKKVHLWQKSILLRLFYFL